MMSLKMFFCLFLMNISLVTGQMEKSSLTFVIDDTVTMQDDINQLKDSVDDIFDTVQNSEASLIEDFILVTFNDKPNQVNFVTRTKDRKTFKSKLSQIRAHGGGNCPESSLSGIKRGLQESRNGSFLYVFTDDVADESRTVLDEVQELAIRKAIQVFFVLTRNKNCGEIETKSKYQYYIDLAKATSGNVYLMDKNSVKEILKEVSERIKTRQTQILSVKLAPGYGKNVMIPIDAVLKDTVWTIVGTNAEIKNITAPDGSTANSTTIVDLPRVKIVKISNPMVGNYTAIVGSETETHFVATATTTNCFKNFPLLQPFSKIRYTPDDILFEQPESPYITSKVGERIRLHCKADGYPTPTIAWRFLSSDAKRREKLKVLKTANSPDDILTLIFTSTNQGGLYICTACNNKSEKSLAFNVIVNEKTYIRVESDSRLIRVVKGARVRVPCQANGNPKATVTWTKNGYNIPTGHDSYSLDTDGALLINNFTENANFLCEFTYDGLKKPARELYAVILKPAD